MSNVQLPRPGPLGLIQYAGSDMQEYAAAVSAAKDERIKVLEDALRAICSEQDARQGYASVETYDAARAALEQKP